MTEFRVEFLNPENWQPGTTKTILIRADDMDQAMQFAVQRARKDGIFGADWRAKLDRIGPNGWSVGDDAEVALRNDLNHAAYDYCGRKLAAGSWRGPVRGGGIRLV